MLEGIEGARPSGSRGSGPTREQIGPAALDLIERFGPSIMRTARHYSQTPEDAEDAFQRSLEILLTKAPSTDEAELLPWLRTVVKHEAFALRKQRDHHGGGEEAVAAVAAPLETHEQVEQRERLRVGAEAIVKLKPQELRCLLLLADGLSYREICDATGFSYTKVNRCLTEGRRTFLRRVAEIESGAECVRLEPLLSAVADGEAAADQVRAARRHLRGCLACRTTLAEFRSAPSRVAALVPPVLLAADPQQVGASARGLAGLVEWMHERIASLALKLHGATEMVSANKAAVAASTVAIAGGGVGAVTTLDRLERPGERSGQRSDPATGAARDAPGRHFATPPLRDPSRLRKRSDSGRRGGRSRDPGRSSAKSGVGSSRSAVPRASAPRSEGGEFAGPEASTSMRTSSATGSRSGDSSGGEFLALPEQSGAAAPTAPPARGTTARSAGGEFDR